VIHSQETTVGGHVKLTLYDFTDGKKNGVKGNEYAGMALTEMIIYISSELTDKISVDLQPLFNNYTGATPRFKSDNIWKFKKSSQSGKPTFNQWRKAVLTALLPHEIEVAVGIVKPRFTWEYGAELFWEEETNGGKFSCNEFLGSMREIGMEIYKPFELGSVSLPTYFYVVNGSHSEFNDNNKGPTFMIHVEPEIGPFKFLGSLARGRYDDANRYDMTRYAAGVGYEWSSFSARAEFAGGVWEKSISAKKLEDATPYGYYAKLFYRFSEWGKVMLHYDYVYHNFNGFITTLQGGEKYTTFTPGLIINVAGSSLLQIQYDIADWKRDDDSDKLEFTRLTVGWRTTF